MLDVAGVSAGARVLDIACGAGDQSLAAARRVGSSGHVVATDISEEMIRFVREQARAAGLSNVTARCCAAEELNAEETRFDAVICRLGLMLFPEPQRVVRSILEVLRPGGGFGAIVIASPASNPFLAEPLQILRRHAGKAPPPPGSPGIFALADPDTLRTLLEGAGFADVTVRTLDEPLGTASAAEALRMMQDAFGVYRAIIGDQPEDLQQAAWGEVFAFLKGYDALDGLRMAAQFHVTGAAKPR